MTPIASKSNPEDGKGVGHGSFILLHLCRNWHKYHLYFNDINNFNMRNIVDV